MLLGCIYGTMFESIAKTNTTHAIDYYYPINCEFESIAKTNTTHAYLVHFLLSLRLRVLLKQIQHTL